MWVFTALLPPCWVAFPGILVCLSVPAVSLSLYCLPSLTIMSVVVLSPFFLFPIWLLSLNLMVLHLSLAIPLGCQFDVFPFKANMAKSECLVFSRKAFPIHDVFCDYHHSQAQTCLLPEAILSSCTFKAACRLLLLLLFICIVIILFYFSMMYF